MSSAVTVRYFARFQEETGTETEKLELDGPQPLNQFLNQLVERHPGIEDRLDPAAIAINMETVKPRDATVSPGDEVALLPPFGGGRTSSP